MGYQNMPFQTTLKLLIFTLAFFLFILSDSFIPAGAVLILPCSRSVNSRKDGTGCHRKNQTNRPFSIPFSIVCFGLALVGCWLSRDNKEKNLMQLREIYTVRNGGISLQKRLSKRKGSAKNLMKIYTAEDMKTITSNYNGSRIMYRDRQSTFYKDNLPENGNREVVIKKIPRISVSQVEHFVKQLEFFSLPHRNLVRIMGCCLETESPLLVYDLKVADMNTLFKNIHDRVLAPRFTLEMRVKAAAGAARALAYMHSGIFKTIFIHGKFNSHNFLLNSFYDAKLFDTIASTHSSTSPQQELTEKSDVYTFGIVLIQLLTGDDAFFPEGNENGRDLGLYFVKSVKDRRLVDILDDELKKERDSWKVKQVAMLAERCLSVKSQERPSMKEVEAKLHGLG